MKLSHLLGALCVALVVGVGLAHASGIDLLSSSHTFGLSPDVALAMSFMPMAGREAHALIVPERVPLVHARPRGLMYGARADVADAAKVLAEMQKTFEDFKAEHTKELADLKKGMGDVVQSEKVDRINAEIGKLQTAIDQVNSALAAVRLGSGGGAELTADQRAYDSAWGKYFRRGAEDNLRELEVKASASSGSDPDGGFTVPTQTETTIDRVLGTVSVMRQLARVVSVSSSVYKKLVGIGGTTSGWVGEKTSRTETNTPQLSALEFPVMEIYANPAATQTLLDDSALDIAQWLADEVAIEFAEKEGAAFVSGDGVNKPRGILSYTAVADASYAWGKLGYIATGASSDFNTEDPADCLIDLTMALKQGYRQNATWLMNRTVQGKVRKFKDDQDNYLWQPGIKEGQPATLLGYPVADDDNMSDVGSNAYPVAFGDFQRGYLVVDRVGIRVLRDPYTNKPHVQFYTTKRVGGGVQNFQAIKLLKCASS